jgi:hypothetical protein
MGVKKQSISPSALAFFGLTSNEAAQYRLNLFSQIHEIVFHGKGGYDWNTIYNMPIWLRKFTFNKIKEFYEQEAESTQKAQNPNNIDLAAPSKIPEAVKKAVQQSSNVPVPKPGKKPSIKAS